MRKTDKVMQFWKHGINPITGWTTPKNRDYKTLKKRKSIG